MTEQTINLRPKVVNVLVRAGDAWSYQVTYPTTLVGAVITAQLRATKTDPVAVNLVITNVNLAGGVFRVGQVAAATSGEYDIQIVPAGGVIGTPIAGRISVEGDVTRP